MTTTHGRSAASAVPQFALAGSLLEGLAAQDFAQLGGALAADARLRALLPPGLREWTGAQVIADRSKAGSATRKTSTSSMPKTVGGPAAYLH